MSWILFFLRAFFGSYDRLPKSIVGEAFSFLFSFFFSSGPGRSSEPLSLFRYKMEIN